MINLELYRAFYAIAKTGSLTAASKELYVSQPALSQSILNLETQLGGKLFVRTQKGMTLTPEGEKMLEDIEHGLNYFKLAENNFLQMKHLAKGIIRIGASDTLCRHYLLKYITKFHDTYPDVNIEITNRTTSETLGLLRAGKVDVAFVNLPIDTHEFNVYECMSVSECFVGNSKYKNMSMQNIEDISKLPLVMLETSSNTRLYVNKYFSNLGHELKPGIELGSFDLVVEFAKAGLGVGCVTKEFIKNNIDNNELYEIPTSFQIPKRHIGGITRKETTLTFAALKFMELVIGK